MLAYCLHSCGLTLNYGQLYHYRMKRLILFLIAVIAIVCAGVNPALAQDPETVAEIKRLVPYSRMLRENRDLTLTEYNVLVREAARKIETRRSLETPIESPYTP